MRALAILALIGLGGCQLFSRPPPPEQILLAVCTEFVTIKTALAERIEADGALPEESQAFDYDDLLAIRTANRELNGFCPPPDGFSPYLLTVRTAKAALTVLASQAGTSPEVLR